MAEQNIVIWLPSPMGDAIMAVPALRALRQHFAGAPITFFSSPSNRRVLCPTDFCDGWIDQSPGFLQNVRRLKTGGFTRCILLKNSFGSALTAFLAGIPSRIGYARDGRSRLLTEKISPLKDPSGQFLPVPAISYYCTIAESLGADTSDRTMELAVDENDAKMLDQILPELRDRTGPLVIFVPGGGFGPSKIWPSRRFSETADRLIENHHATIVLSIAPNKEERQIAAEIQRHARHPLLSLSDFPLPLGRLKALFAKADLVIANDTGPRHIAIALRRKIVTLFGPNNPQRTQIGYAGEIQIVGAGPCVPCDKPVCRQSRHTCMESISVEQVLAAAENHLAEAGP